MVTRFGLAPRRAGLSMSEFQTHWHDKHGPLVKKFKGVKRIWQNHALLRDGMPLLPWTGFDSCAELDFDDLAAMKFAMSEDNYPPELHADTPHMVDMTKAAPMPCERIHITGAIDLRNVRLPHFHASARPAALRPSSTGVTRPSQSVPSPGPRGLLGARNPGPQDEQFRCRGGAMVRDARPSRALRGFGGSGRTSLCGRPPGARR